MNRRHLIGTGVVGGLAGLLADRAHAGEAAQGRGDSEPLAAAVDRLRDELQRQNLFTGIQPIRDAQQLFLRANGKLPDFIEVSLEHWFAVHDWHIRWQQPLTIGRDTNGRYTLLLMQTVVVMRPDTQPAYIGLPYDQRIG